MCKIICALICIMSFLGGTCAFATPFVAATFGFRSEQTVMVGHREERFPYGVQAGWSFLDGSVEGLLEYQSFPTHSRSGAVAVWNDRRELITWGRYMPTTIFESVEPYIALGAGALFSSTETRMDVADGTQIDSDLSGPRLVTGMAAGAWVGKIRGWGLGTEGRVLRTEVLRDRLSVLYDYEVSVRVGYRF